MDFVRANTWARDCLWAKMGLAPSYLYVPWLVEDASEYADVHLSLSHLSAPHAAVLYDGATSAQMGCEANAGAVWAPFMITYNHWGQGDLGSFVHGFGGGWLDYRKDDGVSSLPSSYPHLKEGVERFLITDINNPAASAKAQSEIAVMFDAFATGVNDYWGGVGDTAPIIRMNHVPGGSNVLYMDGHVEFLRYADTYPIINNTKLPANSLGYYFFRIELAISGGWG